MKQSASVNLICADLRIARETAKAYSPFLNDAYHSIFVSVFKKSLSDIECLACDNVTFECEVNDHNIEVHWYKENQVSF